MTGVDKRFIDSCFICENQSKMKIVKEIRRCLKVYIYGQGKL